MKVKEAAQLLGKSEQFIRIGLQQGVLPFGVAVKMRGRYSYHISEAKIKEYAGGTHEDHGRTDRENA